MFNQDYQLAVESYNTLFAILSKLKDVQFTLILTGTLNLKIRGICDREIKDIDFIVRVFEKDQIPKVVEILKEWSRLYPVSQVAEMKYPNEEYKQVSFKIGNSKTFDIFIIDSGEPFAEFPNHINPNYPFYLSLPERIFASKFHFDPNKTLKDLTLYFAKLYALDVKKVENNIVF